jgi:hypothetical protein
VAEAVPSPWCSWRSPQTLQPLPRAAPRRVDKRVAIAAAFVATTEPLHPLFEQCQFQGAAGTRDLSDCAHKQLHRLRKGGQVAKVYALMNCLTLPTCVYLNLNLDVDIEAGSWVVEAAALMAGRRGQHLPSVASRQT